MNLLISILVSSIVSFIIIRSYLKKIGEVFDEILEDHRQDITKVTIDTINEWLDSRVK